MIKPNNRASPEGKQADLATLEEVFPLWQLVPTPFHRGGEGDREAVEGGPPERRHYKTAAKPPPQPSA